MFIHDEIFVAMSAFQSMSNDAQSMSNDGQAAADHARPRPPARKKTLPQRAGERVKSRQAPARRLHLDQYLAGQGGTCTCTCTAGRFQLLYYFS